jgi:hypothetical protein
MRYLLLLLCFFLSYTVSAQQKNIVDELQVERVGQGRVTVHQDADIAALLGVVYEKGQDEQEPKVLKARGYRVQVYAGNYSRVARQEANEVADKLREEFPELPVYIFFQAPRWLCRVGDYRSIEEADAVMRRLKATGDFKEVSIVREQINIPLD